MADRGLDTGLALSTWLRVTGWGENVAEFLLVLRPREFCRLERELVRRMAMRKKRQLAMGPVQDIKLRLLDELEAADPEPDSFVVAMARAVVTVSGGGATGPAQAVASDLEMDWQLARSSDGFAEWLRTAASGYDPPSPAVE